MTKSEPNNAVSEYRDRIGENTAQELAPWRHGKGEYFENILRQRMDRRGFLKGAGALGVTSSTQVKRAGCPTRPAPGRTGKTRRGLA